MASTRITLKDIALQTGYSVNTVSRVLRGDMSISEKTRNIIQKAADDAGYIKNNFASSLRSGSSHLIAIVINDICNPHYAYLISEIEPYLREQGYDILILWSSKEGDANQTGSHIIRIAVTQSVDGILYFPYQHDCESIEFMERSKIPFVLVDRKIEGVKADVVCCDDYAGGKLAAQHLLALGHRSFLYLQGPAYSSSQTDRERGFTQTLKKNGVTVNDIHFVPDEILNDPTGANRLVYMLRKTGITAALAFRDEVAYQMINQLSKKGVSIPGDLSVIGFDHLHGFFPYLQPLTSVFCKREHSLGLTAAKLLLRRIRKEDSEPREIVFPVELYQEGTTRKIRRKILKTAQ